MDNPDPVESAGNPFDEALAEARAMARDQLEAAAQIQLSRLVEQFSSGWSAQIERIFEERLAALGARIEAECRTQQETELARAGELSRREIYGHLNQAARRLRNFESEEQWSRALVDATETLAERAVLFVVNQRNLELRASRNVTSPELAPVPFASAPAFASAIETRDTVVALRTRGELSEPLANLLGEAADRRFSLFPLATRDRVVAVLYADSDQRPLETSGLELLASFAAAVIAGAPSRNGRPAEHLHTIFGVQPPGARPITWDSLNKSEQEQHLRAQRFARVQVAEMRLYQSQAVKDGRANRHLYASLQRQIDAGREIFRRDYMSALDSMVDYYHLELLRTLANDDADLLGKEYPGPMV